MNQSFLISSHNDYLSSQLLQIASRTVPCTYSRLILGEGYERASLLSENERILIRNFEQSNAINGNIIQVFFGLLQKLNRIDTFQQLLVWLNNLLENSENFSAIVFESSNDKNLPFTVLFNLLSKEDDLTQVLAAKISAGLLLNWKGDVDLTPLLNWCTNNLRNSNPQIVDLVIQFLQTLLWVPSRKILIYQSIGLMSLYFTIYKL